MHRIFEEGPTADAAAHEREVQQLYEQIGRLKVENDFLKKNLLSAVSDVRTLIEPEDGSMSISQQCELLSVCRSSYYYEPAQESPLNLKLMRLIDEMHMKWPFAGSRMLSELLGGMGYQVNRKRIRRLMKIMNIEAHYPGKNTSKPHPDHKVYPYLLRGVEITGPNHVWSCDSTYLPLRGGFLYLMAIIDWFSRAVLDWEISSSLAGDFCCISLQRALSKYGPPVIFNTDQGAQFTARTFVDILLNRGIQVSMDGRGRALDNVFIERLWRTVKYEEVYLRDYGSGSEAYQNLKQYFKFYNTERPHSSLDGAKPLDVYKTAVSGVIHTC
jgi:putative transposase